MPKFSFQPEDLKRALALARTVKPETGDFCFKFASDSLIIFSFDRRRYVCSRVPATPDKPVEPDFQSPDYYVTLDRTALFDSDLTSVTVSVNEKSMSVSATDGDQTRNASLKRKAVRSKRPPVPSAPDLPSVSVQTAAFEALLHQVSCSALVKETKTEEEMRVNQVHFYADDGCACSSARYYGSAVYLDGLGLDLSVVSSDIPALKSFCSKSVSDVVSVSQDKSRLYLSDPVSGSFLALSRVATKKPPLSVLDPDGFQTVIVADHSQLLKNLGWAQLAIEGTQRLGFRASRPGGSEVGEVVLWSESAELSRFPVRFLKGDGLSADFPVRFFHSLVKHVDGDVSLGFSHPDAPTVLGVFPTQPDQSVRYVHYLQSMRAR